ncbi:MAG: two-component system sensor histidine kinase/response regulator [Verrucomicrobiales bacterium]|jgi:two-component system sensor histidine kinase/response regulator
MTSSISPRSRRAKLEIEQRPFYLRDCIESTIDAVAPRAMEGALNLGYHMPANTPCCIVGDEARLRQILLNLLGNAVKFTKAGAVEARVTIIHNEDTNRSELRCLVTDTGIGIASEKLGKLFQSFEQLESSTTRRFGGTGLGLSISKRLVELMGGSLSVVSKIGEGSTCAISLPVEIANLEPRRFENHHHQALDEKKLLLLNPGESSRETIIDHAELWGCHLEVANTVDEAIQRIKQGERFDLIVTQIDSEIASPERQRELAASHLPTPPELIALRPHDISLPEDSPFSASVTTPLKPATLFSRIYDLTTSPAPRLETTKLTKSVRRNIAPATELQPLNLLVAEDVEVNRKLIHLMLEKLGYGADFAKNGREALEMACDQNYDIILMDMQMPELDGLQATIKIREQIPGGGPVILAVTANSMDRDQLRCLEAGMDDHLSKPLALPELKSALSKWSPGSGGRRSRRAAEGLLA